MTDRIQEIRERASKVHEMGLEKMTFARTGKMLAVLCEATLLCEFALDANHLLSEVERLTKENEELRGICGDTPPQPKE